MNEQEHRFSESDLAPDPEDQRAARRALVDRVAACVAVIATGGWIGGMVALGACAAPFVFRLTPYPHSADAMGAAFARFDSIALGAAVLLLGAEVARTWVAVRRRRTIAARVRRMLAFVLAGCAAWVGLAMTPRINALHREGARRGVGDAGAELDRVHKQAELVGKAEILLGVGVIVLHVFTLGARRPEDDEDDDAPMLAPLPPGPRD